MKFDIGSIVFDNWTIKQLIGEGSFGKVYEIERENFGAYRAALKVITVPQTDAELKNAYEEGMDDQSVHNYFYSVVEDIVREFVLMNKLKGMTNVVSYEDHEVIPHEDGIGWDILIRMELLTPLLTYAYEHPFSRREIIKLGIDICRAMELCQKYNIIHRDIKPENIFVSDAGDFKLGDFGIARTVEKTMSGLSKKGTYSYMAPEVYRGGAYGFGVDIYSLGIVMYRLLNNNRLPFLPPAPAPITYSEREAALARRMSGEMLSAPINGLGRLGEIVLKACAFDPKERYASPMQMRQELEVIQYDSSDAEIIYPSGDELILHENQYVSRKRTAEHTSQEQTKDGTQSIFGNDAPEGTSKTEGVFGQSIPLNAADPDRTESVFSSVAEPGTQKKKKFKQAQKERKKPTAKKGIWIAIACILVAAVIIICLAAFRGVVLSVKMYADDYLCIERNNPIDVVVGVKRFLANGPYEDLQVSVSNPETVSVTYNASLCLLTVEPLQIGDTEITISDKTGDHTDTCNVSVEPRIFLIGDQTVSEEDETVRFLNCDIDSLQPLLELPKLREVGFYGVWGWGEDENLFEPLNHIETLERITLIDLDVDVLDVAGLPTDVEIVANTPIYITVDLGYGERLSLQDLELPFGIGQRVITWESGDFESAWIDEETQEIVASSVRPTSLCLGLYDGIDIFDTIVFSGHIENMDVDVNLQVYMKNDPDYKSSDALCDVQIAPTFNSSGFSIPIKIEPVIEECYGFDYEYFYHTDLDSTGERFSLYISQDGKQWRRIYTGTYKANINTKVTIRFDEPTDFQYFVVEEELLPMSYAGFLENDVSALYLAPMEDMP